MQVSWFGKGVMIVHVLRKLTLKTHDGIFPKQSGLVLPKVIRRLCEGACMVVYLFALEITFTCETLKKLLRKKIVYIF